MAEIKLTKNELRTQQLKLIQLQKYLPTLQLKKALLQIEVDNAKAEMEVLEKEFQKAYLALEAISPLFTEKLSFDLANFVQVKEIQKEYENIAGVEVPVFVALDFAQDYYSLFETPAWVDAVLEQIRALHICRARVKLAFEKKLALEKELREVSIRVNLFEKVLIPRASQNIKKIKVFLGDQELAAVSRSKVAKTKILSRQR